MEKSVVTQMIKQLKETNYLCVDDYLMKYYKSSDSKKYQFEEIKNELIKSLHIRLEILEIDISRMNIDDYFTNAQVECLAEYLTYSLALYECEKNQHSKFCLYNPLHYELTFINNIKDVEESIKNIEKNEKVNKKEETNRKKQVDTISLVIKKIKSIDWSVELRKDDYHTNVYNELFPLLDMIDEEINKKNKKDLPGFGWMNELESNYSFFYRGQGDSNYSSVPSVYRNEGYIKSEHLLYKEIQVENYKSFMNADSRLDLLTTMQHFSLPTRLLDITKSPLIALFFAVESNNLIDLRVDGELIISREEYNSIKYFDSDTVEILSAIVTLNYMEKQLLVYEALTIIGQFLQDNEYLINAENKNANKELNNEYKEMIEKFNKVQIVKKLHNEIEKVFHLYLDEINPFDLFKAILVLPRKNNERIIMQQGAFIIYGLLPPKAIFKMTKKYLHGIKNNEQYIEEKIKQVTKGSDTLNKIITKYLPIIIPEKRIIKHIIPSDAKLEIKQTLDKFSVKDTTVYPDLDNIATALKRKYLVES